MSYGVFNVQHSITYIGSNPKTQPANISSCSSNISDLKLQSLVCHAKRKGSHNSLCIYLYILFIVSIRLWYCFLMPQQFFYFCEGKNIVALFSYSFFVLFNVAPKRSWPICILFFIFFSFKVKHEKQKSYNQNHKSSLIVFTNFFFLVYVFLFTSFS